MLIYPTHSTMPFTIMLTLRQVTLSRGTKVLLRHASVSLYEKQKIGLVGLNGCGKSSLFGLILRHLSPDSGDCLLNSSLRISHLSQQLPESQERAIDFVLAGDKDYQQLLMRLQAAEQSGDDMEIVACHTQLQQTAGYSKPAQAATILAGLGFSHEEQQAPVNSFSGGWRMRLSLAQCLMQPADLMLLDEPTNHLDMEAIFWLEKWLKQVSCSVMVISHDREFLDMFVSHILHIEQQSLTLYTGNYSAYEIIRAQKLALQQATYVKQQQKIQHMMEYVNRFRYKASKAKQAQSRLNAIEKIELVAQAQIDSPFSFQFYPCPKASNPLLSCSDVTAGYDPKQPILKHLNLILTPGSRIALLGPNGEGKSTIIKTLTGILPPLAGTVFQSQHLNIGYYAQHQLEQLDLNLSPIQTIQALTPEATEQTIRNFLGGFYFIGDMATHAIHHFSGGEKARLALAKLVWLKPNLLLLDEPTNHLDLNMRAAIELALQQYEGALILISHDRHLLRSTVDEFYLVYQKQLSLFKGDLDDYHEWLQKRDASTKPNTTAPIQITHREKRSMKNRLKKLEQLLDDYHVHLTKIESQLAEASLYEAGQKQNLDKLLQERTALQTKITDAEEEWYGLSQVS